MPGKRVTLQESTEPTQITEEYLDELVLRIELSLIQQKVLNEMYDELEAKIKEFFG